MTYSYSLAPENFSDWAGLHTLLMDSFAYMAARIDPPSSLLKLTPDLLREKSTSEILLVVYAEDLLVACAFFQPRPTCLYVGKVAVASAHRRRGITREIFAIAANLARRRSKSCLELQTRVELIENHQTFAKLGFVQTGQDAHTGFNRPTSITMRKVI